LQTPEIPWPSIARWVYRAPSRKPKSLESLLQDWVEQFEGKSPQMTSVQALLLDFRLASWLDPVSALVLMSSMCLMVGSKFEGPLGVRSAYLDVTWLYRMSSLLGLDFLVAPIMETETEVDAWLSFRRAQRDPRAPRIFLEYWEERSGLAAERLPWVVGTLSGRLPRLHSKAPVLDALLIRLSLEELQINRSELNALSHETGVPWVLSGGSALQSDHEGKVVPF
jgi:hypothetical protein